MRVREILKKLYYSKYNDVKEANHLKELFLELKIDNENFIKKCEDQAKKVFYETITAVPHSFLDRSVPSLYHIEINSQCNLKCKLCGAGNISALQVQNGIMNLDYFKIIIEKIKNENSDAIILPFGNSEPFLNKNIYDYIKIIKNCGLRCTLSSNVNIFSNIERTLMLEPDTFIISISGFTQDIYSLAHRGGDINIVKKNIKMISDIKFKNNLKTNVIVNYHLYNYNWKEDFDAAKKWVEELGFVFAPNCARSISMEMTLQYMRQLEKKRGASSSELPFSIELPQSFYDGLESLIVRPDDIFDMYEHVPSAIICPFANFETYIRSDGSVQLCGCCSDKRLVLAPNYLHVTHEDIQRRRRWHPFCEICLRTKTYLYFNMVDFQKWDSMMKIRLPGVPSDRLLCGERETVMA